LEESRRVDVYGALGFEANCKVRHAARVAGVGEDHLPEHCGLCPQERFLGLPDNDEDVLYGGAAGGSKSTSLLLHALRTCVRYPGIQAFWFRRTFPELDHSVLRMLARFGHAKDLGARYDKGSHELRFLNGSILTFAHAKNIVEATALQSAEINVLYLDERTTIPPDVVDHLYTRVRSGVEGVPCLGIRSGTNPGDIGHLAVLEGFVEPTDYGRETFVNEAGRIVRFIQAKATDTPQLDPETYEKRLAGIADPALRAAMRDGSWEQFANQAFGEFRRARHCVPTIQLPDGWRRYGGMDYGWTAPSVYLLAARDNDGRVWVYRELTMTQTPEREQARRVLAVEDHKPSLRAADPAMWGRVGSAMPPSSQMAMEGLGLTKADNDRVGGWSRLHTYLAEAPSCPMHHEQGWDSCPMLHILESECPQLPRGRSLGRRPALSPDGHRHRPPARRVRRLGR
jgi:hypothetical protein